MAQRVVLELTDDIDGSPASETVTFALDGRGYEIDLTAEHAGELRAALHLYVTSGRRTDGAGQRATVRAVQIATGYSPPAVRAWAASNHIELPARGRIPAAVIAQYHAAGY